MRKRRLENFLAPAGLLALAAAVTAGSGCKSSGDGQTGACVSELEYFAENVWGPIMSQKCTPCHNPTGLAKDTKMVLHNSAEAGFLQTNLDIVKNVASFERDGVSLILLKPTLTIDHKGGQVIEKGSQDFAAMQLLVERFKHQDACQPNTEAFFAGVELASPLETLRKAAIALAGRLPTDDEKQKVASGGMDAMDPILAKYMSEPAFYTRLMEIYNDLFLTDRYANGDDGLGLIGDLADGQTGYDPRWYQTCDSNGDNCTLSASVAPDTAAKFGIIDGQSVEDFLRNKTSLAVAREPVELIAHVVKNDRPFTEIITANYILVNPLSAKAYQVNPKFTNPYDLEEWQEAQLGYIPHSGVLTSPMFLQRHPTTPTNRNRHRARMVYQWFLGTDILKTAERPIDPTKVTDFNPTRDNPSCLVCHAQIDPIAGAFHTFGGADGDDSIKYFPKDTWITEMAQPGFGDQTVPYDEFPTSVQWLGHAVARDPRFALAAVMTLYKGLTGHPPLLSPSDPTAPDYNASYKAFLAQYQAFDQIAKDFASSNFNLKVVVRDIIRSPYFRAKNAQSVDGQRAMELADVGTGALLSPEQLNRKILAVTGYPWRWESTADDHLMAEYKLLYGGIDSNDVVKRMTEPNGIMANISDRMSNEMSCLAVPRDFQKAVDKRVLFKLIEPTFAPKDENGFDVLPAVEKIKAQIQELHSIILGEDLDVSDPEIQRTYQLFVDTWAEGTARMKLPDGDPNQLGTWIDHCAVEQEWWTQTDLPDAEKLTDDPNYTIRSWMAVVTYLMSDYAFLYQ